MPIIEFPVEYKRGKKKRRRHGGNRALYRSSEAAGGLAVEGIGVAVNIHVNTSIVGNVAAGLDDLHSFSLPAGSLATNGDYLTVWYGGFFATNDNDKRLVISFGGQTIIDSAGFDQDQFGWSTVLKIVRVNSTTVRAFLIDAWGFIARTSTGTGSGNGKIAGGVNTLTVLDLASNAMTMLVQGESIGSTSDDVNQNLSIIERTRIA